MSDSGDAELDRQRELDREREFFGGVSVSTTDSNEYTPTTAQVRMSYGDMHCPDPDELHDDECRADAQFDRWIRQHDEGVRREQRERRELDAATIADLESTILAAWQVIDHNCEAYKILAAAIRVGKETT